MSLLKNDVSSADEATSAVRQAHRNWEANASALAISQPWVVDTVGSLPTEVTWVFGRDGFLTCQTAPGRWWGGCSLPRRAGIAMLKTLEVGGVMGCFLAPAHAGQVAAALEKLRPEQAVLVIQPDLHEMRVLLACADFSTQITKHRLWFAAGSEWASMLLATFANHPGLPTPARFIRTQTTDEELVNRLIPAAEKVLNEVNDSRAKRLKELTDSDAGLTQSRRVLTPECGTEGPVFPSEPACPHAGSTGPRGPVAGWGKPGSEISGRAGDSLAPNATSRKRLLLVAPSHFRLWDDAGHALRTALTGDDTRQIDPDDPAQSSAMGLALAAMESDAVVVPNLARAGLPAVVPDRVAVLSWITQPRIPAFDAKFPKDGLLLADPDWLAAAKSAGWPAERLTVAAWPHQALAPATEKCLALLANTCTLETPITQLDASSHHLLWEMIRYELAADPFVLGTDVNGFLNRRRSKLGIGEEGFDRTLFIDKLIVPAYQQGLARMLLEAGVPLKLYGSGWDELPDLCGAWAGRIDTREGFAAAVVRASALVYAWPMRYRHPIDASGRAVLAPSGKRADTWVRAAKGVLHGNDAGVAPLPELCMRTIDDITS